MKPGKAGIPDSVTLHRWRVRLKAEAEFDEAIEAALERCRRVCEAEKGSTEQRGASGTGENEWYTPADILTLACSVLGEIDLDPAKVICRPGGNYRESRQCCANTESPT